MFTLYGRIDRKTSESVTNWRRAKVLASRSVLQQFYGPESLLDHSGIGALCLGGFFRALPKIGRSLVGVSWLPPEGRDLEASTLALSHSTTNLQI